MDFSLKCSLLLPIFGLLSVVSVLILSWQSIPYFLRPKGIFLLPSFLQNTGHSLSCSTLLMKLVPPGCGQAGILQRRSSCARAAAPQLGAATRWLHRKQGGWPGFCRISPRVHAEALTLVSSASSWHLPQLAKLKGKAQLLRSTCFDWQI